MTLDAQYELEKELHEKLYLIRELEEMTFEEAIRNKTEQQVTYLTSITNSNLASLRKATMDEYYSLMD